MLIVLRNRESVQNLFLNRGRERQYRQTGQPVTLRYALYIPPVKIPTNVIVTT